MLIIYDFMQGDTRKGSIEKRISTTKVEEEKINEGPPQDPRLARNQPLQNGANENIAQRPLPDSSQLQSVQHIGRPDPVNNVRSHFDLRQISICLWFFGASAQLQKSNMCCAIHNSMVQLWFQVNADFFLKDKLYLSLPITTIFHVYFNERTFVISYEKSFKQVAFEGTDWSLQ